MGILKPLRKLYIRSTDLTHSYQGKTAKLVSFYRLWSYIYDFSVSLDPAFRRQMKNMISMAVKPGDTTLDIGCGTGISTFYAAKIAKSVTGIDLSADMLAILRQKIHQRKTTNIEVIHGSFPQALPKGLMFDSIISSFTIVHFTPEQRKGIYKQIYDLLQDGGRLGLFSAQGEIASSFETKREIMENLALAKFKITETSDVSDIYRIVLAQK